MNDPNTTAFPAATIAGRKPVLRPPYAETEKPLDVVVVGVYLTGSPSAVTSCIGPLSSVRHRVDQRWLALGAGDPPSAEVAAVTVDTIHERVPKFTLVNRLLADWRSYDVVVVADDDIVLPDGFLDAYLGYQEALDLALCQPARTPDSYVDHEIVVQHHEAHARQTRFVEIGPLFSMDRRACEALLPFPEESPMGWGYENVWAKLLADRGLRQGIVDATPVDHGLRPPVVNYSWHESDAQRTALFSTTPHLELDECLTVLEHYRIEEAEAA